MRCPLGDMVLVDIVQDSNILVTVNNNYGIVRILCKPARPGLEGAEQDIWDIIKVDDIVLVDFVKDYVIGDQKYHFTNLREIKAVI